MKTWAMQLALKDTAALLDQTLEAEEKTDALLSQLAQTSINQKAA